MVVRGAKPIISAVREEGIVGDDVDLKVIIPNEEVFGVRLANKIELLATEPDEVGITR